MNSIFLINVKEEKTKKLHWATMLKAAGRLVALSLFAYFLSRVIIAVGKVRGEKTGVSVTTYFENSRLMPSISVCFRKRTNYEYKYWDNATEVELALNSSR